MACLPRSLAMKNRDTCKDGDISVREASVIANDDSTSIAAQRVEEPVMDGCCSNSNQVAEVSPCTSQKTEMNSLLGSYITKEYELLHLVLSHLPLGDLNAAAKVCRTWLSAAMSVRRSRTHPHWLLWHNGKLQKIPKQAYRKKRGMISEAEFPRLAFHEFVYSEPSLAIMFASQTVYVDKIRCASKSSCPGVSAGLNFEEGHDHRVWDYIIAELQPSCPLLRLRGYGTVGTWPDLTETVELENGRSYSVLLLPKMPGVTFRTFQLDRHQIAKLQNSKNQNSDVIEEITRIQTGESVKFLLLFCLETCATPAIELVVTLLQNRQEETMAVAGGLINDVGGVSHDCPIIVGVAFFGEGVCIASTVLDQDVSTEHDADKAMQELRAHTPSSYNSSIGLMFACVCRGKHLYRGKRNVESAAFRRHFPRTPLLGYFGSGEIGFRVLPDVNDNEKLADGPTRGSKKKRGDIPIIVHSYTTIMVHIAFTGGKTSNHSCQ